MASVFLALFALVAAGVAFRRIPGVPPPEVMRRVIGAMVLNVFLPALTFRVLSNAPESHELWMVPGIAILTALTSAGIAWVVVSKWQRSHLTRPQRGTLIMAATFCNATYLGLPVVSAVVGPEYARIPVLFDLLGMSLVLFTLGSLIGVTYGNSGERLTIRDGLRHIATLPPFIAAAAGLAVNILDIPIPKAIILLTELAGHVVAPTMLFSIGLALQPPAWPQIKRLTPAVIIKLLFAPAVAFVLTHLTPMTSAAELATVLEAAMPTMVLTMVFAERYQLDTALLAQTIVVSTVISAISLPLVTWIW